MAFLINYDGCTLYLSYSTYLFFIRYQSPINVIFCNFICSFSPFTLFLIAVINHYIYSGLVVC